MHRDLRKPLVVFTPKWLLRLPAARSRAEEFEHGHFQEVQPDPAANLDAGGVTGVVLTSGKVFYELAQHREQEGIANAALVRLEQYYPFPRDQILEQLRRYPNATEVRWVQEEPENMGAYRFVHWHLSRELPDEMSFSHVARDESGSPATGSATVHAREQQEILRAAFEGL